VVVVTHNAGDRILRCIACLLKAGADSVVVVDNASGDGTVQRVRHAYPAVDFPAIEVVALPRNVGFGSAVNVGVRRGRGAAVVLVNDDAYVAPDFICEIVRPLDRDPSCGMVAGLLTIPGTDRIDSFGIEIDQRLAAWSRGRPQPVGSSLGPLSVPSGGAVAYRREAFEAADGFDERLFAYWEDVDLGIRLARAGWGVSEAPLARGEHEGGASFSPGSPFQRKVSSFGRGFVLRRFLPRRPLDLLTLVLFETLHVVVLVATMRNLVPVRERVRGWRVAGGWIGVVPDDVLVRASLPSAIRRLARLVRA
jgi:GT2 family glycosyltransferase